MKEDEIVATGPPLVGKGTPISVKGAGKSTPEPQNEKSIKVEEPEAPEEQKTDEIPEEPTSQAVPPPSPLPVTAADKDLQAIDMGDDIGHDTPSNEPKFTPPKNKKSGGKKFIKVLIILIVVALVAFGAWWFLKKPKNKSATPTSNAADSSASTTTPTQPEAVTIKTYKNETIKIELSYPSTWKTTEETNQVVFKSPEVSYVKKDGTSAKGKFSVSVKKGFSQVDSTTINNGVAVKTSELVKYTAPAPGQRTESYLSYLGPDQKTFMFILITSGKQYQPGNTVAATLPLTQDSYIVFGGYSKDNGLDINFDTISPDKIQQNVEVYNQAVEIIKSLKITG